MCTFTYGSDFSLIISKKNGKYKCKITEEVVAGKETWEMSPSPTAV